MKMRNHFFNSLIIGTAMVLAMPAMAGTNFFVNEDFGGDIDERAAQVETFRVDHTKVHIMGECDSSCTYYLGLENTCVSPDAVLGFHAISYWQIIIHYPDGHLGYEMQKTMKPLTQSLAVQYYNPALIKFLNSKHALDKADPFIYNMTGKQIISFGYKACN